MPSTNEDLARIIGFISPQIVPIPMRLGARFRVRGKTTSGRPFEIQYEIVQLDQRSITLKMDVDSSIHDNFINVRLPLRANELFMLPKGVNFGQPQLYIAFVAPSASEFRPKNAGVLIAAVGEVRDTVPPPPPKR